MNQTSKTMDSEEKEIKALSKDIDPTEDNVPDSLAEATTVPLADGELGGTADENDVKRENKK